MGRHPIALKNRDRKSSFLKLKSAQAKMRSKAKGHPSLEFQERKSSLDCNKTEYLCESVCHSVKGIFSKGRQGKLLSAVLKTPELNQISPQLFITPLTNQIVSLFSRV